MNSSTDSMPPSEDMTNQAQPYSNYGYSSMQSTYRQGPASHTDASPSHDLYGQAYSQVKGLILQAVDSVFNHCAEFTVIL